MSLNHSNALNVYLKRKIPFVTKGMWIIMVCSFLVVVILDLVMWPVSYASDEVKTLYYIWLVPDVLKVLSVISVLGIFIVGPIYFLARLQKKVLLTLEHRSIKLKGKSIDMSILFMNIKTIYFNEAHDREGNSKEKIQIVVEQIDGSTVEMKLVDYNDGAHAMEMLGKIDGVKFRFYDFAVPATIHED